MAEIGSASAAANPQADGILSALTPRPTWQSSAAIKRDWSERLKEHSLFSARTTCQSYLDMVKKRLAEVAAGTMTPHVAEDRLRESLRDLGYRTDTGFQGRGGAVPPAVPGSITDLSSSRRIQLILDTNVKQARSLGQIAASSSPAMMMTAPAWRLTRTGARRKPRGNWKSRWAAAGAAVGWQGAVKNAMMALKSSPIWQALADGAGGYRDTIGSPYPPFAFGSGMAWVNVSRREWIAACRAEGAPDGLEAIEEAARRAAGPQGGARPASATARPTRAAGEAKRLYADTSRAVAGSVASAKSRALAARGYANAAERAAREARMAEAAGGPDVPQVADRLAAVARDISAAATRAETALKAAEAAAETVSEGRIRALLATPAGVSAFPSAMRKTKDEAAKAANDADAAYLQAWKRNETAKKLIKEALGDG